MPHIVHSWRWGAKPDTEYIVPNGRNAGRTIHFPLIPAKSTLPSPYRPQFFNHVAQIHSSTYWSRGSSQSGLSSNDWFPNKRCSDHGSLLNLLYHQTVSHLHTRPVQPTCLLIDLSLAIRLSLLPDLFFRVCQYGYVWQWPHLEAIIWYRQWMALGYALLTMIGGYAPVYYGLKAMTTGYETYGHNLWLWLAMCNSVYYVWSLNGESP